MGGALWGSTIITISFGFGGVWVWERWGSIRTGRPDPERPGSLPHW